MESWIDYYTKYTGGVILLDGLGPPWVGLRLAVGGGGTLLNWFWFIDSF